MIALLIGSFLALASDPVLVPEGIIGSKRSLKVDLYYFAPGIHPFGSDWKPSLLEQWTLAVDCHQVNARLERCTFRDNTLWWGYVVEGGDQTVQFTRLPAPGAVELVWSKRGRLVSYDIQGDRSAFHEQASNAMLALYHRDGVVFRPDAQRRIGTSMEQSLTRGFASLLELELPKKGKTRAGAWKNTRPTWATRRYSQGTATGNFQYQVQELPSAPEDPVVVSWTGSGSEAPPGGSISTHFVSARAVGQVELAPGTLRPVRSQVETLHTSSSVALEGHTRFLGLAVPMSPDEVVEPTHFPGHTIE